MPHSFGSLLRWWRKRRGLSQLDLASVAGTSQRHVSFLESGRSQPSREMVLCLAAALDVPLRQQNALLLAAGFAPVWRESHLTAPELAVVNQALDHMLAQQEPFPAVVVDRRWNLLRANVGAARLTAFLTGPTPAPAAAGTVNLAEWLLSPDGPRPYLVNWSEVAIHLLRGIQADAMADGTQETAGLLRCLLAYPGVPALSHMPSLEDRQPPVLAMHFRKGQTSLRLFTTIATLGTPQDVTVQELRIESFFPADAATAQVFKDWAAHAPQEPHIAGQ
ncbi:MAG TPA: helix-turn-helix transcriptional regulator [Alphaproteobacteria bacterium]|nr:helix-turn-helix transcriptional regulator [Alphaproteobacteria bacterium]